MVKKSRLTFIDKLMLLITVGFVLGLLLGVVAGKIDPGKFIYIAFFGLAYSYFLIANVLMVIYWLFRGKWLFSIVIAGLILCGWGPLTASYQFSGDEGSGEKEDRNAIRLMTYNVHQFKRYGENNDISTKDQIFEVIKQQNPDIICFQEYYTRYKGAFDITDSVKKSLGLKYYYFLPSAKNDYEAWGAAIFSRYPIKNTGQVIYGPVTAGNGSIFADIQFKNQVLRIYNVHFQSISFDKQDYDYIDQVSKKMDAQYRPTRRIAGMLKSAFLKRSGQVEIFKDSLRNCQLPFIIAGDFNDTPASYAVSKVMRGLKNAFVEKGQGFGKTYNGKFPNFQIDYIATSSNLQVHNYHISKAKLSDHFPVRSDISFGKSLLSTEEN